MRISFQMEFRYHTFRCFIVLVFSVLLIACANRGMGPTGGPKDITPPVLLRSVPAVQQTNVTAKHIDLYFDEIVQLTNPSEKVVVSPAQIEPATIKAIGKRVSIVLNDSLKANTTYTIDFGGSLADNNEKNILKNFAFSFSTGASIDTMQIAGTVLDAHTLDPVANIIAGIHQNVNDSAFTHIPLLRVAKTSEKGTFSIKGVRNGKYRVFALNDQNGNFFFDQPAEGVAVYSNPVQTSFKMDVRNDTIRTDSAKIDTIMQVNYVRFLPDTLVLRYYKEEFSRQRLVKSERLTQDKITLFFGAKNDTLPVLKPLNFKWKQPPLLQRSIKNDTLSYWIKDTIAARMDTLKMALYYHKSDSVGNLIAATDTLLFKFHHPKKTSVTTNSKAGKETKKKIETWRINADLGQDVDVDKRIYFKFESPVVKIDSSMLHFYVKVDTLWKPAVIHLKRNDDVGLVYSMTYPWKPDTHYKLEMDSAMFTNWKGLVNDTYKQAFRVRALEEYSSLIVNLIPFVEHAVLELLNSKDEVIKTLKAKPTQNTFSYLLPGDYYLRMYIDANDNGHWDTGNYKLKRDPEQVYYFPSKITLRANWDIEQDWNPTEIPLDKQKPRELVKKPEKDSSGSR
ncbi:Ig-like domain-containing protein [Paludibacter jiangxiensis]|uniref:Ig-like domain-containing protein n=1 Tax=Paludibacter jiangxiensis TaxID=681398 RepID=A0A161LX25_9BACT|nr:Ig-like domain-containing protein [Paludibacter jiangxiensis]